ncbi:MAG TPA: CorA family divalent cation transporter [Solirubrobacterales bacterium]|nr:CorA family divalent cation transporter [Solirubrobacterales bacterium]
MSAASAPDWLRRTSAWQAGARPEACSPDDPLGDGAFRWFELVCGPDLTEEAFDLLATNCPGLTKQMLEDLLTPDDAPAGISYGGGTIRLASTFAIEALRRDQQRERGTAQGVGALRFQPVELLAGERWLISCWHPGRTFQGAIKIDEDQPDSAEAVFDGVAERWSRRRGGGPGDLGVAVMNELALSYAPAHRALFSWLEDWELSLYVNDDLDNRDELPELWGLMAVMRDWLNPLNRPGLRADLGKAWLPAGDHAAVIEVDDRVDKALAGLAKLSERLRQSFGLLHLEQSEEQREHSERMQRRIEIAAAVFLVPTLVVGFYGANTWVPGQGKHWGFWVMVALLILLSFAALLGVLHLQRRASKTAAEASRERRQVRTELLRGG